MDPEVLAAHASAAGDGLFSATARIVEEYLTVGDFSGTLDYAELVYRSRLLLTEPRVAAGVTAAFDAVLVDDVQEADPAQIGLLADLAALGLPLLALGTRSSGSADSAGPPPRRWRTWPPCPGHGS